MTEKRPLVRGEPVVNEVLDATLVELSQAGYRALRIENVAARAGVHKTTIYRRWPEKVDLVEAALLRNFDDGFTPPDTGALRTDLLEIAKHMVHVSLGPTGKSLVRMLMAEHNEPDVVRIVRSLRATKERVPRALFARAAARGELREGVDGDLIIGMLAGTIHHMAFAMGSVPSPEVLEAIVDVAAYGVIADASRPR
jgi:AcrR family transcriptional regulator